MFERFTDRARRVVVLAQEEARLIPHDFIGTHHMFLGLVHEAEGVAALILDELGVTLDNVRTVVRELVPPSPKAPGGHIPFTKENKSALERSLREALSLGHSYIGTEHLLLGLCRPEEIYSEQITTMLDHLGTDPATVRAAVMRKLAGYEDDAVPSSRRDAPRQVVVPGETLLEAIAQINSYLSRLYTTTGIILWWAAPNPVIDNRRPIDAVNDVDDLVKLLNDAAA